MSGRDGFLSALGGDGVAFAPIVWQELVQPWDEQGTPLGMISSRGDWSGGAPGVVITPGDVSSYWDAARLRALGSARP